jgi:hypothetical protein
MKIARFAMTFAAVLLCAGAANAQRLKADIPFSFHTPGATMEAGQYELLRVNMAGGSTYYKLSDVAGNESIFVPALTPTGGGAAPIKPARLIFRCVGRSCELAEIWEAGTNVGHLVAPSKRLNKEEGAQYATVWLKQR